MSEDPARYTEGVPDNLPAAAYDALAWLQLLKRRRQLSVNQLSPVGQQRFEACVSALERHLESHLPPVYAGEDEGGA